MAFVIVCYGVYVVPGSGKVKYQDQEINYNKGNWDITLI